MSGFEVVGVVLGAIPLIISALEKYKSTSRRLKYARQKEELVNELIRSLNEQHCFIKGDLYLILKGTFVEDDDIDRVLNHSDSSLNELLSNQALAQEIEECLGDWYTPYIIALGRCTAMLMAIAKSLTGIYSDSHAGLSSLVEANPPKNGLYEFGRRIKFSLAKDDLEYQISELNTATINFERIRRHINSHNEVALPSVSRTVTKITNAFDKVSQHATRLHAAICMGFAGNCHPEHEVHLFLQHRSELTKRNMFSRGEGLAFTLVFGPALPASYLATEIKVVEEKATLCVNSHQESHSSEPSSLSISPSLTSTATGANRAGVSFQEGLSSTRRQLCLSRGFICYRSTSATSNISRPTSDPSSLSSISGILQSQKLPLMRRLSLALTAVSSVMQFRSTPWLTQPLTSERLFLAPEDPRVQTLQPFFTQKFTASIIEYKCCPVRRTMLELGVLLLELWQGRTIESFAAEAQVPLYDSLGSRYDVASKWLDLSTDRLMPDYYDAVKRCVECNFATSPGGAAGYDWNDDVFRKSICGYVLKPLIDGCRL